jgi:hypothetical protein
MNELSPLALRIADHLVRDFPELAPERVRIAEQVQDEIKDYRPIRAYADSLRDMLMRIIHSGDPHMELRQIAEALGIPIESN